MKDNYIVNNRKYTSSSLCSFARDRLAYSNLPDWERDFYEFILSWFSPVPYITIHTSGSTGTPKEILLLKEKMRLSAGRSLSYFDIKPGETALLCLSVKYIAGMLMVVRSFTGEMNLITTSPQHLQMAAFPESVDFSAMVPLQIGKVLDEKQGLDRIKKILIGGALLSPGLAKRIQTSYKGIAWETYGMTETITHVAVRQVNGENSSDIFNALPGVTFNTDERGCLVISDPLLQEHPVVTNDTVEVVSSAAFRFLGRYDHVINSGGIKVQPEEIERIISPYIKGKFCVSSVPDKKLGNMIVLVVERGTDINALKPVLEKIDSYQRPKRIIELDIFPVNSNGKTDVRKIREMISKTS